MSSHTSATRRALLQGAGALALGAAFGRDAEAASYPERPVRIVVPFAAGGPSDMTARQMSVKLGAALGQTFVVENKPGAGSNLGTVAVAHAAADGYTLLVTSSAFVVNPGLYKQVPYDAFKDFAPVSALDTSPNVFIATPASGITSITELIARAKGKPNELSYASAGTGTTPHLAAELLKIAAGIKMTHIPYPGAGPAIQSILAGTVPVACASLPGAHAHILAGKLRALAVTGPDRWYDLPDVPTMVELGYKDFIVDTFHMMLAPAGTPKDIVEKLAATSIAALKQPEFHQQLRQLGFEVIASDPASLRKRIAEEVPRYRDIIEKADIPRV
jgi:tripartite-type tricarboxylate transporter receptor subunit TctC